MPVEYIYRYMLEYVGARVFYWAAAKRRKHQWLMLMVLGEGPSTRPIIGILVAHIVFRI